MSELVVNVFNKKVVEFLLVATIIITKKINVSRVRIILTPGIRSDVQGTWQRDFRAEVRITIT